MKKNRERDAYIMALCAIALWSTVATAFKLALRELDPADLLSLTSFVSWLSLGAFLLLRRVFKNGEGRRSAELQWIPRGKEHRRLLFFALLLGLLNPILYYLVLFAAYSRLPAQAAQPLNYTWPLFLALLAAPINGRKPALRDLIGILISLAGVILVSWRPPSGGEMLDGWGVFLALGSGIIWALYWLIGNRLRMDGPRRLFAGFTLAAAVLAVFWWHRGLPLPESPSSLLAVIWIGFFEMGITFLFWNGALERTGNPARIGNLVYLGPFVSLIWINLILGEIIRPATIAGLAVICAGILYGRGLFHRRLGASD